MDIQNKYRIEDSMSPSIRHKYLTDPVFHSKIMCCLELDLKYHEILEIIILSDDIEFNDLLSEYSVSKKSGMCGMCGDIVDELIDLSDKDTGYELYACQNCIDDAYESIVTDGGRK